MAMPFWLKLIVSTVVEGFAAAKELWRLMVPRFRHVTTEEEAEIVENVTRDDVFCQVGGDAKVGGPPQPRR